MRERKRRWGHVSNSSERELELKVCADTPSILEAQQFLKGCREMEVPDKLVVRYEVVDRLTELAHAVRLRRAEIDLGEFCDLLWDFQQQTKRYMAKPSPRA